MGCVAYLTLWERKGIGFTQVRPGPNRVGPWGLLTPIADAVKLIFKEIIRPTAANKGLFFLAPVMTIMPALAAWAVVPVRPRRGCWPTSTPACCSSWPSPRSRSTA
jgi:NADH-quinone oxidoreductase subunit H